MGLSVGLLVGRVPGRVGSQGPAVLHRSVYALGVYYFQHQGLHHALVQVLLGEGGGGRPGFPIGGRALAVVQEGDGGLALGLYQAAGDAWLLQFGAPSALKDDGVVGQVVVVALVFVRAGAL